MNQTNHDFELYMLLQHTVFNHKLSHKFDKYNNKAIELHNDCDDPKQLKKALNCFFKALELTLKNKYVRSVVMHNLGIFYYSHFAHLPGGHAENLHKSIHYFKQAQASNERKQFPDKYASTLTQHAVAWRRAATEPLWPDSPEYCYQKAEELNKKAIKLIKGAVPIEIECSNLAIIYLNLSTVLLDVNRKEESCEAAALSFKSYKHSYNLNPEYQRNSRPEIEQILGVVFSRLNYFGSDSHDYQNICSEILEFGSKNGLEPLMMMGINPLVDIANPASEIEVLYRNAQQNNTNENRKIIRIKIKNLMEKRYSAETDQSCDRITCLIQQAGSGLARLFIADDQPLEAFTVLEHMSAMRFTEGLGARWYVPSNKFAFAMLKVQQQLGAWYYGLNENALMCEQIPACEVRGYLTELYNKVKCIHKASEHQTNIVGIDNERYLNTIGEAVKSDKPIVFLKNKAIEFLDDINKIEPSLCYLDPDWDRDRKKLNAIRKDDFKRVFEQYPDLTLIKIDIENNYSNMLIIVSSKKGHEIITHGYTVDVPSEIISIIGDFSYSHELGDLRKWALDFIDWKSILPLQCKRVGLLPSFHASHIPWAATGKQDELLLNLVEEVVWLPSLMVLYNQVIFFENKQENHNLIGGNTQFTELSHLNVSNQDEILERSQITSVIRKSKVISYYGHCEHNPPELPMLLLKNLSVSPFELHNEIRGSERVEFWACQSGSNIPLKYLSSPVNEAFGMDMKMLEFGAETAIGTLWAVPELVTAHIKCYYDLLVRQGVKASKALIQAQRWWINVGANVELKLIKEIGLTSYLKRLGHNNAAHSAIDALMGPVLSKQFTVHNELKDIEQSFKHPSAWAGLRFCGLPENKGVYISKDKMALEHDDKIELQQMIKRLKLTSGFM